MDQSLFDAVLKSKHAVDKAVSGFSAMAAAGPKIDRSLMNAAAMAKMYPHARSQAAIFQTIQAASAMRQVIRKTPFEFMAAAAISPTQAAMHGILRNYPTAGLQAASLWRSKDAAAAFSNGALWREAAGMPPVKFSGNLWREQVGSLVDEALEELRSVHTDEALILEQDLTHIWDTVKNLTADGFDAFKGAVIQFFQKAGKIVEKVDAHPLKKFIALVTLIATVVTLCVKVAHSSKVPEAVHQNQPTNESAPTIKPVSPQTLERTTRCLAPVKLNPSKGALIFRHLPANFGVVCVRSAGKWAEVTFVSPEDSLVETGWILKKYLVRN